MVDIALPIRISDSVFGYFVFGKFQNQGFRVIDSNNSVKVMRHWNS